MQPLPILHQSQTSSQHSVTPMRIRALCNNMLGEEVGWLATEEPLEMCMQQSGQKMVRVAVTRHAPGHDAELVAGFLYTEGLIHTPHDIVGLEPDDTQDDPAPVWRCRLYAHAACAG